ncbi:MAG: hypothetical protein KAU20_04670 [Nanoarchaeota archaeon]|nr:hypothetical protein [Nanoarchaeota archaeon]
MPFPTRLSLQPGGETVVPTIKKVGIFDMDGLYKVMQRWFYDNKYYFEETLYKHKPGTAAGKEEEIGWTGWRKVNDYVKFHIKVFFHIYDIKNIEVIKEGKKVKLTKCRVWIEFNGDVELDYTKRFGQSKFGKFLFDVYNKFVLQEEKVLSNWWDELYYRVYKLHTITKEYLDMESKGNAYYDIW